WFTLELIAVDNHITVKVNGQTTADYPDSARRFSMGHITLQQHDPQTVVEFRKIEIKEFQSVVERKPASVPPDATTATGIAGVIALLNGKRFDDWLSPPKTSGGLTFHHGALQLANENDYLLTRRTDFKNFKLRMGMSASKGTKATIMVHHQGSPGAGTAVTSAIYDDGTAIVAGMQGPNYSFERKGWENGMKRKSTPYDQFFTVEVSMSNMEAWISVDGVVTSGVGWQGRVDNGRGALGLVVRKGTLAIRKIEITEVPWPDSADLAAIRPQSVRASADPAEFTDIIGEVAPGFTMAPSASPAGVAIVAEHFGRERVLWTHPPGRDRSCVLTRTIDVPVDKKTQLALNVSYHPTGDWRLMVLANGQSLYDGIVGASTTQSGWLSLSLDLTSFAGKKVAIELRNQATGWRFEWGYWGRVQVVSAAPTDAVKINDVAAKAKLTATEAFSLKAHTAAATRVAFHRTLPFLASAGKDGQVLLWNLETHAVQTTMHKFREEVWAIKFSPDGQSLAYANRNWWGSMLFFKTLTGVQIGQPIKDFKNPGGAVAIIAYSPDGRLFAAGQDDGTIRLWDVGQLREIPPVSFGVGHNIYGLAFGPASVNRRLKRTEYLLAAASQDGTVKTL
ncbi:MAG TPA: DUF1080 domain-containing protein, partial [Pirellulales bacterium]|nr:DUF1080 domain-containing protein [Pirellulales bacterium]